MELGLNNIYGWLITERNIPKCELNNFYLKFIRFPYNALNVDLVREIDNKEIVDSLINKLENKQLLWGDISYSEDIIPIPLSYIDLTGERVVTGKTKHEVWEEFKDENPKLLEELVKMICDSSLLQDTNVRNKEIYPRLIQAFTLLRIKGFSIYPDLTG